MEAAPRLGVTQREAYEFFVEHLRAVTRTSAIPENELLYNASVLAHFATTSVASQTTFPACPPELGAVFDLFVLDQSHHRDPDVLEAAAAQCLLLTGFFQDQQKRRHALSWYAALGMSFYARAAEALGNRQRAQLLGRMAARFEFWRAQQHRLARDLRRDALEVRWPRVN